MIPLPYPPEKKYRDGLERPEALWRAGDEGWVVWQYTSECVAVKAKVVRRHNDGYLTVELPGMWGSGFTSLCWEHQVYLTKKKAEQIALEESRNQSEN